MDSTIRDRVKRFDRLPASIIRPSPHNWRLHPTEQAETLRAVLSELGFAGAVLARELPDGQLEAIDGHLRLEEMGDRQVPVLVTDLDDGEAKKLLALFDPLSTLATTDERKLQALLAQVETEAPAIQRLLDALTIKPAEEEPPAATTQTIRDRFAVLIECATEAEQTALLERLTAEGLVCRSLIS